MALDSAEEMQIIFETSFSSMLLTKIGHSLKTFLEVEEKLLAY